MKSDFEKCKPAIVAAEGGENHNPNDYGGYTRLGVSQREYPQLNIQKCTDEQLFMILKQDFWDKYRLSEICAQHIANQAMLLFMNMNPLNAAKIIQNAVNGVGSGFIIVNVDGVLGTVTIKAINNLPPGWLSDRIRVEAAAYYLHQTDVEPKQIPNIRSWIRRLFYE